MNGRNGERPKRSSGELYDAIWAAEVPAIMDERDSRAAAVAPVVARMVLMAMASFTNPNRDQALGPAKTWQCFAAVATIAEKADVSERQVQRVLRTLEREGYIELIYQARRPGRPRKNQVPGQGRPNTWCLRPDLWPTRALKNRTGVVAISVGDPEISPVPAEVASVPVNFSENYTGTGREGVEKPTGVVTRTRNTYEPVENENPVNKPALADARANVTNKRDPTGEPTAITDGQYVSGFQMALPGQAAVGLDETRPWLGAVAQSGSVTPAEPRWPCPDCHEQVFEDGRGHAGGLNRCRHFGRGGKIEQCPSCREWIPSVNARGWHTTSCPVYRELLPAAQSAAAVVDVEEPPPVSASERNGVDREEELAKIARVEAELKTQPTTEEQMRARKAAEQVAV